MGARLTVTKLAAAQEVQAVLTRALEEKEVILQALQHVERGGEACRR
jgi:hypothetical protein